MIKDLHLKDIFNSPLKKCLKKNTNYNFDFISFYGSFYITSESYLPICSNSFFTSTDLFGFYEKVKYRHLFTPEFLLRIWNHNFTTGIPHYRFIKWFYSVRQLA